VAAVTVQEHDVKKPTIYYMIRGEWAVGFRKDFRFGIDRTYYDGEIWQLSLGWFWIFNRY
jgi:hypothetical protein